MKLSSRLRTPSRLSDSVHRQLNMYALAASAAGVGVLALSKPTEAKIVYTKAHQVIGLNQHYNLDLNHDNVTDFEFSNTSGCTDTFCAQVLGLSAAAGNGVIGHTTSGHWRLASALQKGAPIGRKAHFLPAGMMLEANSSGYDWGLWYDVKNRYLGLEFKIKGQTHYGWARLNVTGRAFGSVTATLTGYAYETIPNKAIIAGKTKGPDVITVQPGSLGQLARGRAAGLAAGQKAESINGLR